MNAILLNRAFRMLVLATWAQRAVVRCEYYGEQQIGDGRGGHHEDHHQDHHVKPLYKFGYWVHDPKTNDVKNHWEHRDGDVVHGSYSLMQPDGHVRVVDYTVDKHSGFNAHVRYVYEGRAAGDAAEAGGGGGGGGFVGRSADASSTGRQPVGRPRPSPNKPYKKPRRGDQSAGRYSGPYRSANADYKKQRPPGRSAEQRQHQSDERGRFDRLPTLFPSVVVGGGGGDGDPFDGLHDVNDRPSDRFARKYSSAAAADDHSSYYAGIRHRPDVASAASTERRYRGSSEESFPSSRAQWSRDDDGRVDHADRPTQRFGGGPDGSSPYPFEMPEDPARTSVDGRDARRTFAPSYFPGTAAEDEYSARRDTD